MKVSIYSREAIEGMIADDKFPRNTAVISFYDPAIKRIDKDYTHVDYDGVCDDVFYSELDDLDLEVLKDRGYTYNTYFPEVHEMADFIVQAYMKRQNIICQCEYGQSRSAGCAAAILEYFYGRGITVFTDYRYYPNQVVYRKVFNALILRNLKYALSDHFFDDFLGLKELAGIEHGFLEHLDFTTGATILESKRLMDMKLTGLELCSHTFTEAVELLRNGKPHVYISLHIDNAQVWYDDHPEKQCIGLQSQQMEKSKETVLTICLHSYETYSAKVSAGNYDMKQCREIEFLTNQSPISFDILGIMKLENHEPVIRQFILTNLRSTTRKPNSAVK